MALPSAAALTWLKQQWLAQNGISQDAQHWRRAAELANIQLDVRLGGVGRGIDKLARKTPNAEALLGTSEMAEMASHWAVAQHRFRRWQQLNPEAIDRVHLPTCGAGLDVWVALQQLPSHARVYSGDLDALAAWFCRQNASRSNAKARTLSLSYDLHHTPFVLQNHDLAFLDPARRQNGQRHEGYEPDLTSCMAWLQNAQHALIKIGPGESPAQLSTQYPEWSWEVVQHGRDVKEVCGSRGFHAPEWRATHLSERGEVLSTHAHSPFPTLTPLPQLSQPEILWLPNTALIQSGLCNAWAAEHDCATTPWDHVYASDSTQALPMAEGFRLLASAAVRQKSLQQLLKKARGRPVIRRSRGVKVKAEWEQWVQRDSPTQPSSDLHLLFCKSAAKQQVLLLEKLNDSPD